MSMHNLALQCALQKLHKAIGFQSWKRFWRNFPEYLRL